MPKERLQTVLDQALKKYKNNLVLARVFVTLPQSRRLSYNPLC